MRNAVAQEAADERLREILEHVQYMADNLSPDVYFDILEGLIDSARRYLSGIDDPKMREDLREMYKEVINFAFELKLKHMH